jgi:hypothetical protein
MRSLRLPWKSFVPFNWVALALLNEYRSDALPHEDAVLFKLNAIYNTIALIVALLLAVGITPFVLLGEWHERIGDTVAFSIMAGSLILMLATCFFNLLVILACLTYLHGLKSEDVKARVIAFPVFGFPFYFFSYAVLLSMVFALAWIFIFLPPAYLYTTVSIAAVHLACFAVAVRSCFRARYAWAAPSVSMRMSANPSRRSALPAAGVAANAAKVEGVVPTAEQSSLTEWGGVRSQSSQRTIILANRASG